MEVISTLFGLWSEDSDGIKYVEIKTTYLSKSDTLSTHIDTLYNSKSYIKRAKYTYLINSSSHLVIGSNLLLYLLRHRVLCRWRVSFFGYL